MDKNPSIVNLQLLKLMIFYFLGFYVLLVAATYCLQSKFLFLPDSLNIDYKFHFVAPFEERFLTLDDGTKINALYFKTPKKSKGLVLYFHGNANNLQRWASLYSDFTSRGYDFFIIDYRGYGKSEGKPDEKRFYQDARWVYDKMLQCYDAKNIVLYGRSLGTGVASQLATEVVAKALVLETPYYSIRDVILLRFPFLYLPFPLPHRFPNGEHLPKVNCPIYIFQGTRDRIVPHRSALKLKPLLKPKDEFITISNGQHHNLGEFDIFQQKLDEIFE